MVTVRTTDRQISTLEIDLAWWDTDDDLLSFDGIEAILVSTDNSTNWTARTSI